MKEIVMNRQALSEMVRPLLVSGGLPCCAVGGAAANDPASGASRRLLSPNVRESGLMGGSFPFTLALSLREREPGSQAKNDLNAAVRKHLTHDADRISLMETLTHLLLWGTFAALASRFFGLFA